MLLINPVLRHVEADSAHSTFAAAGDARSLPADDHRFDAALLLGPLYHLVDRSDRIHALSEAIRVVRPGGWVFAAGLSRLSAMAFVTMIGPSIDLEHEVFDAGLNHVRVIGIEGPGAQPIEVSWSHGPHLIVAARTLAQAFESQRGLRDLTPICSRWDARPRNDRGRELVTRTARG